MLRIPGLVSASVLWVAAALPAAGQAKAVAPPPAKPAVSEARKPQPRLVRMTVSPAAAPRGALRYRLLPEYPDRKAGNRADLYHRAMLLADQVGDEAKKKFYDDIYNRWTQGGTTLLPEGLSPAQAGQRVSVFRNALRELEEGAWRDRCDWGLRLRELRGLDVIALLLPECQSSRELARVLSLRCRVEIAEGRLDDARKTLQTTLQLSRDIAETPTLINGLVGMAIHGVATADLQQLMQRDEAPNMYWALTSLPRPFISLHEAVEQERSMVLQLVPALRDPNHKRTPEEWRYVLRQAFRDLRQAAEMSYEPGGPRASSAWENDLAVTAVMMMAYPTAKRKLIEAGRDRKEVEAMPVAQAVLLYAHERYQELWGDMFKAHYLPLPQAVAEARRADERLKQLVAHERGDPMVMLSALLLPAVNAVVNAAGRSERAIDELRTIEALRMYAAEHGRWPDALEDVKQVPIPANPFTGKPFDYRLDGDTAILEGAVPPGQSIQNAARYELKLRRK